ncbi:hypothetical protein GH714_026357 [Hevea brasiliensis]|uniref:MHD domain-containing protein n=1 Tax=Hevea brasiliensis TaxID=3981 RepID=A0A6A6LGL3_HEVBR|nr:hypothetical protein GH714_026357 [Hevea brasiliensis]
MLPFQGCYGFVHRDPSVVNAMDFKVGASILRSSSRLGKRSTNAFKSHKEAERRRRQRINAHLSTLRSLLPSVTKTDKASLLAKVVHHVKELISQAAQVARQDGDGFCSGSSGGGGGGSEPEKYCAFPGESDEATLSYCDGEAKTMRVSVCCENRPGLNWELSQAIRLVRGRAVRAEMMTVGGLTKCVVVLQWASGGGGDEEARILRRALKAVVENRVSGCGLGQNVDGVNYFHVKVVGLLFVATTRVNVSPSLVLELLQRIARVIKDYLGILNEDSLRKNFVLVYELLDEVIDFGYVQTTSTELLKSYVFNEPIVVDAGRLQPLNPAAIFMQGTKRMPGTAVTKSVVANEPGGRKREEIFVDIIEKISVTFSSSGYILTSEIDGTIQMKSYLTGNPEIRLALNEDLSIGRGSGRSVYDYRSSYGSGAVILDDCNFHESVRLDSFDLDRTLTLVPPDGEFPVMNYRLTQEFKPPFRINTLIEEAGAVKAEVILKISAEFPSSITANTIAVQMPLPKYTTRATFELEPGAIGQTTDFKEANKRLEWGLKKIVGGSEHTLRAKLTFSQELHGNITKEAGPVSMTFTIPMYNASRLQVKYLQIAKKSNTYNPYRWVRYVTQANSYVARI